MITVENLLFDRMCSTDVSYFDVTGHMSDVSKFIYIRLNRTYLALLLWKSLEN